MAQYLQIGNITYIRLVKVTRSYARNRKTLEIPTAFSQVWSSGTGAEAFQLQCHVKRHDTAAASAIAQQLTELFENPDQQFAYFQFPANYTFLDGFYLLDAMHPFEDFWFGGQYFPFTLDIVRLGTLKDVRLAERWLGYAEKIKGWSSLSTVHHIYLPKNAVLSDLVISGSVITSDGLITQVQQPPANLITFKPSTVISDWLLGDCKVFDSIAAGDSASANWFQVFSARHKFSGDSIYQNGTLRYNASTFQIYFWNDSASGWANLGYLNINSGSLIGVESTKITPSEVRWREVRKTVSSGAVRIEFTMLRGAKFFRTKILTKSSNLGVTDITVSSSANIIKYYYNSSSSGTSGSGNLPLDSACSYQGTFSTACPIIWGHILTEQPGSQPLDMVGGSQLGINQAIATGASMVSFIFAANEATAGPPALTAIRTTTANIAMAALSGLSLESILVGTGYF